ncbi:MAG: pirin family protein, partial [Bacteroidota bacterium]
MATPRSIAAVIDSTRTMVAPDFEIRRALPVPGLEDVDPFLLIDHMGPKMMAPNQGEGVPDHPHRGFQTITYMLDGKIEHKDSQGNQDVIGPGDIQWMTAGSGIVHSEMFEKDFREA